MLTVPPEELWEDVAFLAYHLRWELDVLLDLEHRDRRRLVEVVTAVRRSGGELSSIGAEDG